MIETLERGDIRFFYRPRVQPAHAIEPVATGVQSFFVVLAPAGRRAFRRVRIGKKRMPLPTGERFWARVERFGSLERVLAGQLEDEQYQTKTQGERFQPGARAIAAGCYAFVRHDDHIHLAYRVDEVEPDDIPDEVRVPDASSLIVLFERLESHGDSLGPRLRGADAPRAIDRPRSRGRAAWTVEGFPARLDDEGAELVFVGVDDEPEQALGIDLLETSGLRPQTSGSEA